MSPSLRVGTGTGSTALERAQAKAHWSRTKELVGDNLGMMALLTAALGELRMTRERTARFGKRKWASTDWAMGEEAG